MIGPPPDQPPGAFWDYVTPNGPGLTGPEPEPQATGDGDGQARTVFQLSRIGQQLGWLARDALGWCKSDDQSDGIGFDWFGGSAATAPGATIAPSSRLPPVAPRAAVDLEPDQLVQTGIYIYDATTPDAVYTYLSVSGKRILSGDYQYAGFYDWSGARLWCFDSTGGLWSYYSNAYLSVFSGTSRGAFVLADDSPGTEILTVTPVILLPPGS